MGNNYFGKDNVQFNNKHKTDIVFEPNKIEEKTEKQDKFKQKEAKKLERLKKKEAKKRAKADKKLAKSKKKNLNKKRFSFSELKLNKNTLLFTFTVIFSLAAALCLYYGLQIIVSDLSLPDLSPLEVFINCSTGLSIMVFGAGIIILFVLFFRLKFYPSESKRTVLIYLPILLAITLVDIILVSISAFQRYDNLFASHPWSFFHAVMYELDFLMILTILAVFFIAKHDYLDNEIKHKLTIVNFFKVLGAFFGIVFSLYCLGSIMLISNDVVNQTAVSPMIVLLSENVGTRVMVCVMFLSALLLMAGILLYHHGLHKKYRFALFIYSFVAVGISLISLIVSFALVFTDGSFSLFSGDAAPFSSSFAFLCFIITGLVILGLNVFLLKISISEFISKEKETRK